MYKNKDNYWIKRAEELLISNKKTEKEIENTIKNLWDDVIEELETDIYKFYLKYAGNEKISLSKIYELLNFGDVKNFKKMLNKEEIKNFDKTFENKIISLSVKKKIKRIEYLKFILNKKIQQVYRDFENELIDELQDLFEESFLKNMYDFQSGLNVGFGFDLPNEQVINKIINENWLGNNLSDRIWGDEQKTYQKIEQEILKGIAIGENPKEIGRRLSKALQSKLYNAIRLARTEINRILNDANLESIKEVNNKLGGGLFEKYKYLATLDSRTSKICGDLDLKEFPLSEKQTGINFPPMHPNCRSTFIITWDDEEIDERIAKRLDNDKYEYIPSNISYNEWKEKFLK